MIKNTQTTMKCSDEKWSKIFGKKKVDKEQEKEKSEPKKQ